MTLILLVLVTMVSIYTSRTVVFEQRVSGNDFRTRQAFEAAESGMSIALAYIADTGGADKDNDGAIDPIFDTDADGIGDTNTAVFADLSSVTVTIGGAFPQFQIQSVGLSDDQTATRTIRTIGSAADGLPNSPDNPLTARGPVIISGAATVYNPEGNSTIWSGSDVDLGSNNATATEVADPGDPNYPDCMDTSMTCGTAQSSNRVAQGLDVVQHDSSLQNLTPEDLFINTFGMSMTNYRASRVTHDIPAIDANNDFTDPVNPGAQLAAGEIIWIEGDTEFENNTTIGCTIRLNGGAFCPDANLDPVIVIVNGDLTANGTPNITGLLYVTGNFDLLGNIQVEGAVIVAGDLNNAASGSMDIWYNSDVLEMSRFNGPVVNAPGSWQDW